MHCCLPPIKIIFCFEVLVFSISLGDITFIRKPFDLIFFCGCFHVMFVHTCKLTVCMYVLVRVEIAALIMCLMFSIEWHPF